MIAVVKELNLKKIKMSPGPVAAMAAHSPNGSRLPKTGQRCSIQSNVFHTK